MNADLRKINCNTYNISQTVLPNTGGGDGSIGYTPQQIQTAYGINLISLINGKPLGYGIKIAVITAYHYSNLQNDLNKYCKQYGLKPITLNIINQAGTLCNSNWALETCLDVQMINSVCPGATVYVIESKSNTFIDIKTAILTAVNLGVNIISMSFGTAEFSTQSSSESLFLNSGITFVASSGDSNYTSYPGTSANVLAVGGTTLLLNIDNTRLSETTWSTSGSGVSVYTNRPTYQSDVNSGSKRNIPDVSLIANTSNGFSCYCNILGGFLNIGGTSAACALMASIVAIANQMRRNSSKPMLSSIMTSPLCIQTYLYKTIYPSGTLYSNTMYDVTLGLNGLYSAGVNYDVATGLGSIKANSFCSQLVSV